jgi:hypothetical protein
MIEWTWQDYLNNGYTVVLDNDGWWFTDYSEDENGDVIWEGGGDGPYGQDLLVYLLEKHYNGVEFV